MGKPTKPRNLADKTSNFCQLVCFHRTDTNKYIFKKLLFAQLIYVMVEIIFSIVKTLTFDFRDYVGLDFRGYDGEDMQFRYFVGRYFVATRLQTGGRFHGSTVISTK